MDKENNIQELPGEDNWLDEILGISTPKADLSSKDLADSVTPTEVDVPIDPKELELENILAENWSSPANDATVVLPAVEQTLGWEDPSLTLSDATIALPVVESEEIDPEPEPEEPIFPVEPEFQTFEPEQVEPVWEEPVLENLTDEELAEEIPAQVESIMEEVAAQTGSLPVITEEALAEAEPAPQPDISPEPLPEEPPVVIQPEQPEQPEPAEPEAAPKTLEEPPVNEKEKTNSRPKNKKGFSIRDIPSLFSTLILGFLIVIIGVSAGHTLWLCVEDVMGFGKPTQEITVTITSKDDIDVIAEKLHNAGLIEQPKLFKLFATLTGKDEDISAGTFTLNRYYDYNAMINAMGRYAPAREVVTVTIPEGYTCAQTFALLAEYEVCSVEDLESYAEKGELDEYWFLEGVERNGKYCLEGYLFPDTYEFYTHDDAENVLEKMLDAFDYRFNDKMREDMAVLQEKYGEDFTVRDVVILASMVERETANSSESFTIASVYYNRLNNPSKFPRLECDATVHYAIGDYFGQISELTAEHLATDSPYNTRLYSGMPPGPISNPGINSLNAVLYPEESSYYYYIFDRENHYHRFAKTLEEHNRNAKELGY